MTPIEAEEPEPDVAGPRVAGRLERAGLDHALVNQLPQAELAEEDRGPREDDADRGRGTRARCSWSTGSRAPGTGWPRSRPCEPAAAGGAGRGRSWPT